MQFISLCPKGFRLISVQPPDYMTHDTWCKGFERFLDKLGVDKVHLFGTSIGGYQAQCFVQYRPQRVLSMILCNTFSDTSYYKENAPCVAIFPWMPDFMLKRIVLANFPSKVLEQQIANSVDFMVLQLEALEQRELASRLTLNCSLGNLNPAEWTWDKSKITVIDAIDEVAIPEKLREEVYKFYPEAKVAELKTGGNFPYLSRVDEVNMHIQVHLRRTSESSKEEETKEEESKEEITQPSKPKEENTEEKKPTTT